MHRLTDFVDVGLGSDSSINSKIDEVLTVDLALGEMIASWPHATRMTLSLIQTNPPPTSLQAGEIHTAFRSSPFVHRESGAHILCNPPSLG